MRVLLIALLVIGVGAAALATYLVKFSRVDPIAVTSEILQPAESSKPAITYPDQELPSRYVIPRQTHVYQTFNNCGPASLSIQLSYHGVQASQETLGESLRPYQHPKGDNDDKSVTLAEMADEAEKYGLQALFRPNGSSETLTQLVAAGLPVVVRTWLKPDEDIGHYRVIRGYDLSNNSFIQDDSLQGKNLRYSFEEMNELWQPFNYEYLVLYPPEKAQIVADIIGDNMDERTAWENARQRIEQELARNPDDIYAQFNMSVTLYHLQRYQESIEYFEKVESRLPARTLWYQREPLLSYYEVGEYDQALQRADAILDNNNRAYSELYYLKAQIFLERGETEAARFELEKAVTYNKNYEAAKELLSTLNSQ